MQEDYKIPAKGTVDYEYFYIPTNFTEAKYVQAIEVRPGNRKVVHHVLVQYQAKPDLTRTPVLKFEPEYARLPEPTFGDRQPRREQGVPTRLIGTYAPGTQPAGVPRGHGAPSRARRRHRTADALHHERQADDRSDEGRDHLLEGSGAA